MRLAARLREWIAMRREDAGPETSAFRRLARSGALARLAILLALALGARESCRAAPDYLSFTACDGNVTLGWTKDGDVTFPSWEWQTNADDEAWIPWTGTVVIESGKTVYLRHETNSTISAIGRYVQSGDTPEYAFVSFTMEGSSAGAAVKAGGSVMSLLSGTADPGLELGPWAFLGLFHGCALLVTPPALPATNLSVGCYYDMFSNSGVTLPPALPAASLQTGCYSRMFSKCARLTTAPALASTELAVSCYASMFEECAALSEAPKLPAATLTNGCYGSMFSGCTNLSSLTVGFSDWNRVGEATESWLGNVAGQGVLTAPLSLETMTGASGVPEGWLLNPVTVHVPASVEHMTFSIRDAKGNTVVRDGDTICRVSRNAKVEMEFAPEPGYQIIGERIIRADAEHDELWLTPDRVPYPNCQPLPPYFSLHAVGGDFTVSLAAVGKPETLVLETTADPISGPWEPFLAGESSLRLAEGSTCYFRRQGAAAAGLGSSEGNYWHWSLSPSVMLATVEAGGDVMTLLDATGQRRTPGDFAFLNLFADCQLVRRISVGFTDWNETGGATKDWVRGLPTGGEFFAPSSLPRKEGDSFAPKGWLWNPVTVLPNVPASLPESVESFYLTNLTSNVLLSLDGAVRVSSNDVVRLVFIPRQGYAYVTDNAITVRADRSPTKMLADGDAVPVPVRDPGFLSFAASGGSAAVRLSKIGAPLATPRLEWTRDFRFGVWTEFAAGQDRVSVASGETVYFRRRGQAVKGLSSSPQDHWRFEFDTAPGASVAVGGDLTTLLDARGGVAELDEYAFARLFEGCTALETAPRLPSGELSRGCYLSLFKGCPRLSLVEVGFRDWAAGRAATEGWLDGVASEGVFLCPAGLDVAVRGASRVPFGWLVNPVSVTIAQTSYMTAVVSNETGAVTGAEGVHFVSSGATVRVCFVSTKQGCVITGGNPLVLERLSRNVTIGPGGDYPLPSVKFDDIEYCDWDGNRLVTRTLCDGDYQFIDDSTTELAAGRWFVAMGSVTIDGALAVAGEGTAHLVLVDGAELVVTNAPAYWAGVAVGSGQSLSIYGQRPSDGRGELRVYGGDYGAGIGGCDYTQWADYGNGGAVTVNGGDILAVGGFFGAGIGGGNCGTGGVVTVNGGRVSAVGGFGGAGVGGGRAGDGGRVTVNGDGVLLAYGGAEAAGIGGSGSDPGEPTSCASELFVNGNARVEAYGGVDGAGVGGGLNRDGGAVTVMGGTLVAKGGEGAAGIGGGAGGRPGFGEVRLLGGKVSPTGGAGGAVIEGGRIEIAPGVIEGWLDPGWMPGSTETDRVRQAMLAQGFDTNRAEIVASTRAYGWLRDWATRRGLDPGSLARRDGGLLLAVAIEAPDVMTDGVACEEMRIGRGAGDEAAWKFELVVTTGEKTPVPGREDLFLASLAAAGSEACPGPYRPETVDIPSRRREGSRVWLSVRPTWAAKAFFVRAWAW